MFLINFKKFWFLVSGGQSELVGLSDCPPAATPHDPVLICYANGYLCS
jgi:hypothetical protein